jgi:predicted RNA-binding Zn ribbon-like protein
MAFKWNKHRFSGGALVFDLVNTVVRRLDPDRREDRLSDCDATTQFADAALLFRSGDMRLHSRGHMIGKAENQLLLEIREAAHDFFLPLTQGSNRIDSDLAKLLKLVSNALTHSASMPFATDVAISTLNEVNPRRRGRLKACPNCDWLFLDKSKNSSRIWCDMAVCGNREKARRNYLKRRTETFVAEAGS